MDRIRRAFTLVELLVVIVIILAVSAVALPSVLSALKDRQTGDAARILHAALAGARDAASAASSPRGLRFLPDPAVPLSYLASGQIDPARALVSNQWVLTEVPPDYAAGTCSVWPGTNYSAITTLPCLVLEEQPGKWVQSGAGWAFELTEPTNWWWTVRLGERVSLKGQVLTVCGPLVTRPGNGSGNAELFANAGLPGITSPWSRTYTAPDGVTQAGPFPVAYLFLVNGKDDDGDGFVDSGWDGLDNNGNGLTDEAAEWETERWPPTITSRLEGAAYSIARRPVPSAGQQAVTLPSSVVIDLSTWSTTSERSHLPVNPYTGAADLIVEADGTTRPDLPYAVRSSLGMTSSFFHFWLADRQDVVDPVVTQGSTLTLPIPPALSHGRYLVQVQARTGRITSGPLEEFAVDVSQPTAAAVPFLPYRQGQ